jgi:AraC-like DNA-binding protein
MFLLTRLRNRRKQRRKSKEIIALANILLMEGDLYLDTTLKCSRVAQGIGSNRTYLWAALHTLGHGFQGYLARFRIIYFVKHARELAFLPKDEIAERCGFTHEKYLSKYLKEMFGMTLSEYLKIIRREKLPT